MEDTSENNLHMFECEQTTHKVLDLSVSKISSEGSHGKKKRGHGLGHGNSNTTSTVTDVQGRVIFNDEKRKAQLKIIKSVILSPKK